MEFTVGTSEELVAFIMSTYTSESEKYAALQSEVLRFFWNSLSYRDAVPLIGAGSERLSVGGAHNFVYDKHTGLVFFDVSGGTHNMLMSYLGALATTDFTKPQENWVYEQFTAPFDGHSKKADLFIEGGHGLFHSSVGAKKRIMVAEDFDWTEEEFQAFRFFTKYHP
ncbi:hypothetical protein YA0089_14295 [Pseudomonas viridiflava]|uniref:hypothetical protein n=1 Tax=Pseudomonas viridiflava TaxID=33069 RepID=UPI0018E5D349|nr:hypothetical protein [Pseudomonas viridiflava]MBI6724789.1 hypothetical protein [Pseudomonas viridiflava]